MVQRYPKNISFGRTLQVVKVFVKIDWESEYKPIKKGNQTTFTMP